MNNEVPMGEPRQPLLERRLATIMMADVAGYSRMMGENEERTVQILRGHREIFDALLAQHRGRIFNTAGDAILAEFPSAVEAVRCATEIQAAVRTRNEHLPEDQRMWFRIGVNLGDVIVQGEDLLGDGVNVAARIQTVAEPGGVCISGSVYDQIQNKLSLQFRLLGERSFKNIAQPIRTFSIAEADGTVMPSPTAPARPKRQVVVGMAVVAVLLVAAVGGLWIFREYDTRRTEELQRVLAVERRAAEEQRRLEAVEADRQAAEVRRKAAEEQLAAEAERRAKMEAEASQRQAQLNAEAQAAREALARAEAEKKRLDQELKRAATGKQAAPQASDKPVGEQTARPKAAEPQPSIPAPIAVPPAKEHTQTDRFEGVYEGRLCSERPAKMPGMRCWPVILKVDGRNVLANWTPAATKKQATARGTIAADGAVRVTLNSWTPKGDPIDGSMSGKWEKNVISLSGKWNNGMIVSGTWKRGP